MWCGGGCWCVALFFLILIIPEKGEGLLSLLWGCVVVGCCAKIFLRLKNSSNNKGHTAAAGIAARGGEEEKKKKMHTYIIYNIVYIFI